VNRSSSNFHFNTRVPIREVMRCNPTTIKYDGTVARAAMLMCRDGVGSCIVLSPTNIPLGIVTEEDINCKVVAKDTQAGGCRSLTIS